MALGAIVSGIAMLLEGLNELNSGGSEVTREHQGQRVARTPESDRVIVHHYKWHEREADRLLAEADAAVHAGEQLRVALCLASAKPHVEGMEALTEGLFTVGTGDRTRPRYRRRLQRLTELAEALEGMSPEQIEVR